MGQLYYRNLHVEFFERFPKDATDFYALSGYLGPDPIRKLLELPLNSCIMYGLQRETPNQLLHEQLKKINGSKVEILYPEIPSHAKCYLWLKSGIPIRGLVGSANFSTNGLNNDFRETLLEIERPDLFAIKAYLDVIKQSARSCEMVDVSDSLVDRQASGDLSAGCDLMLYDPKTGQVQEKSGLNWGFANANVTPNDAYIPIRAQNIREFPTMFQPVFWEPEHGHRARASKEAVELIWDDGVVMGVLFEGAMDVDGLRYPKQISSIPAKNILGQYLRSRLGLNPVSVGRSQSERITRETLFRYGRDHITLKAIQPGVYSADFSPR